MKLLYSVLITSLQVASNVNSGAASAALRGEESRVEENATRRHLKDKGKSTTLFDTAVTEYEHQKIASENAVLIKEAEDAYAGYSILFGGANPEGCKDSNTCLSGADPYVTEFLREFSAQDIMPWLQKNGGEGAQYLMSTQDLLQALTYEGTDDVYEILNGQLVTPYTSDEGGRRLEPSCPKYNAKLCRSELHALTRRGLTIAYGAMSFVQDGKMADRVMDKFKANHWCQLEDWFIPLIATSGAFHLDPLFWTFSLMAQFSALVLMMGFAATGTNGFLSIVSSEHAWYEMIAFGAIWTANSLASSASGGATTFAAIVAGLSLSAPAFRIDIFNFLNCLNLK